MKITKIIMLVLALVVLFGCSSTPETNTRFGE